jgi:hypothetical protein
MHTYLLTYLLTELRPSWEATNCSAPQELPSILWNPKIHYLVQRSSPLVPILSHLHPICSIPSYLSKIHFNIVLVFPVVSFLLAFPPISYMQSIRATCPTHLILHTYSDQSYTTRLVSWDVTPCSLLGFTHTFITIHQATGGNIAEHNCNIAFARTTSFRKLTNQCQSTFMDKVNVLASACLTVDTVLIGNWIYWTLTDRNYK